MTETGAAYSVIEPTRQAFLRDLKSGAYLPGERLPGERELARRYGIGRSSMVKVLHRLEKDIPVRRGAKYDFSVFMRYLGTEGKHYVHVQLNDPDGNCLGEANFYREKTSTWEKVEAVLTANADCDNATLTVIPQSKGDYHFDMISFSLRTPFTDVKTDSAKTSRRRSKDFTRPSSGFPADASSTATASPTPTAGRNP